jgi:TolA-binding protein
MLLQEVVKSDSYSELTKYLVGLLALIISNLFTYLVSRPKSASEIAKNKADVHRSEAEVMKSNAETIRLLSDELDDAIEKIKRLRGDVSTVEDLNKVLKKTIDEFSVAESVKVKELHLLFEQERQLLITSIGKTITAMNTLVDELISKGVPQDVRMNAVRILEALHSVKKTLENASK